jgi:hypothetical protein
VSKLSALGASRANHAYALREALAEVARGTATGGTYLSISRAHRRLAVGTLLADASLDAFRASLTKSGQAYAHMLNLVRSGASFDPYDLRVSVADAFFDALAAGDLDTARVIARLSPNTHLPEDEYEDDFLRNRVFQCILLDPDDASTIEGMLFRWADVIEDEPSVWLDVAAALYDRLPDPFEDTFDALLERRAQVLSTWRNRLDYRPEIDATEGAIFVEALGILRLAELLGLPTRPDYRFAPDIARIPLGLPLPPPGAWQTP